MPRLPRTNFRQPLASRAIAGVAAVFALAALLVPARRAAAEPQSPIDFNRDVRPILSNNCFQCHGPDAKARKGGKDGLRLDEAAAATQDLGGYAAVVPGKPEKSELLTRITSTDPDAVMPPAATGKKLTAREIDLLKRWVQQGAPFAQHWSYTKPVRPEPPTVKNGAWPKNPIDRFLLARIEREGLAPLPEADRATLARRAALDLTGLPPTPAELEAFLADSAGDAYEKFVARLLQKEAYGEHWARMWLDLARYADSSGYADDPARTIWAYRDYVIRSFNANKPFDQFTIEQLAGDLLPNPTQEQLVATAFHRNTQTNNEGGTNDEEFRNVAVVDRVNTTFATWMATTMNCCQCHNHKYDPLSQEEFFRFFAILNNTEDADRGDDSPRLEIHSPEQLQQKSAWERQIAELEAKLKTPTPELAAAQARWEQTLAVEPKWQPLKPARSALRSGGAAKILDDGSVLGQPATNDAYQVSAPVAGRLSALRLETVPDASLPGGGAGRAAGNFIVSRISAALAPPAGARLAPRFVRIELPGSQKMLSLAEVQVFSGAENVALLGAAKQSSTDYQGEAKRAIDGNTNGDYNVANSTTHTAQSDNPWWEVDLQQAQPLDRIVVWNRTDGGVGTRLAGFKLLLLDAQRKTLAEKTFAEAPNPSQEYSPSGSRSVPFTVAFADYTQNGFDPQQVLDNKDPKKNGWAVGGKVAEPHALILVAAAPLDVPAGALLEVTIEHLAQAEAHGLGRFRLSVGDDPRVSHLAKVPVPVLAAARLPAAQRSDAQRAELAAYFQGAVAAELQAVREELAKVKKQLADYKPATSVPILRELPENRRRKTQIQLRGNFLDLAAEVQPGLPAAFSPLPEGAAPNRLTMAQWLVDANNPLTARVLANRLWEQIFGVGIVRTSEEFGSQGELPSHPELLDWLATELVRERWDIKKFLTLLVTSAAYRQSSLVTAESFQRDPENRLLARGPRFRMSAEMIRDQALFVGGLLSPKLYGPPVKPPQPSLGLSAAFGSGIDWQTSQGDDKFRRGIYTTWRRSNPYPSMAAFDAPNREVCTVQRARTNTPLQALVTLNDPVYIEAAQALARRLVAGGQTAEERARLAFKLCLCRPPNETELKRLLDLHAGAVARFQADSARAMKLATAPLGPAPQGADLADLAAWTLVGNVVMNLDEMFMRR